MSVNDPFQINQWLSIYNQSFSKSWQVKDYIKNNIEHKVYNVTHTYFLMDDKKCIGVISEAIFKKNKQIGVGHNMELDKNYRGGGLGKYMVLYFLHKMKKSGLKGCEGESNFKHQKSIFIHFGYGFAPKLRVDYWNIPDRAPRLMRLLIDYKFRRLYEEWKGSRS